MGGRGRTGVVAGENRTHGDLPGADTGCKQQPPTGGRKGPGQRPGGAPGRRVPFSADPQAVSPPSPSLLRQQGRLWCLPPQPQDCPRSSVTLLPRPRGQTAGVTYVTSRPDTSSGLSHLPWVPERSPPGSPPSSAATTLNLGLAVKPVREHGVCAQRGAPGCRAHVASMPPGESGPRRSSWQDGVASSAVAPLPAPSGRGTATPRFCLSPCPLPTRAPESSCLLSESSG